MVLLGLTRGGCGGNTVKNTNHNNNNNKEEEKDELQVTAGNKFSWPRRYENKKRPSSSSSADHLCSSGGGGGGGGLVRLGKYELGRTLGEGNFGKVKYARNLESGQSFAIKILEKHRILDLNITHQVRKATLFSISYSYYYYY